MLNEAECVGVGVLVYLAAVNNYLFADNKMTHIIPRLLQLATRKDEELNELLPADIDVSGSSSKPNINYL